MLLCGRMVVWDNHAYEKSARNITSEKSIYFIDLKDKFTCFDMDKELQRIGLKYML